MKYTVEKAPMSAPSETTEVGCVDAASPVDALRRFSDEPVRVDLGETIEAGSGDVNWTVKLA